MRDDRFTGLNVSRDSKTIMSKARRNGHEKSVSVKDVGTFSEENTVLIANFSVVGLVVVSYPSNCLVFWGGSRNEGFRPHGFQITFKVSHCKQR